MGTVYRYKNKSSGKIIDSDIIVKNDENGILEYIGNGAFRFTAADNVIKEEISADSGYYEMSFPQLPDKADINSFDNTSVSDLERSLGEFRDYIFGIDSVNIQYVKPNNASAFVSQDIEISSCSYVELSVKESSDSDSDIEYYVMDGINEYPILPIDKDAVNKEKIFYNLDTRFKVDQSKKVTIYCNNAETTYKYPDIKSLSFYNDNEYTISYEPLGESHKVFPKNKKIKIKAVCRNVSDDNIIPTIQSIVILKYGGVRTWTM